MGRSASLGPGQRVVHRGYRLIGQRKPLPATGKFPVDAGGVFPQTLDEVGPVVNYQRPGQRQIVSRPGAAAFFQWGAFENCRGTGGGFLNRAVFFGGAV